MHVFITGASTGIGEAIARAFAAPATRLTLVARRTEQLSAISKSLECESRVVTTDLSSSDGIEAILSEAEGALGPVDVLINNAGVQNIEQTQTADVESGERLLRLNLFTPLRLTRAVLPAMLERKSGTIVDVASMAALAPTPGMFYYNASKAGLAAASESLRGELRGTGVHVVTVYPGIIMTNMGTVGLTKYVSNWAERLQPRGDATTLGRLVVRAVETRGDRVIYPAFNHLARHFPATTRWALDHFTPRVK
ncbi:MAG: SDR family NAD(P)-dependent oxidoreductase [Deltaproteobacteria bacterium]|nr:SDR family NAD(P)-dependent oxidoreductase [Deltaproteobacteria bacterium]